MAFDFYYSLNKKFNDFLMLSGENNYTNYLKKIDPLVPASSFIDHCTVALSLAEIDLEKAKFAVDLAKKGSKKELIDANKQKKDADKIKNAVRQQYMKLARNSKSKLPEDLSFEPGFTSLPNLAWLGIEVAFTLNSPWYSKDDRPFHVLDNPIRRDRLFGKPFMSASSWKGLLRWACRMKSGLLKHLEKSNMKMDGWKDKNWIVHLFGNEKGEKEDFRSGTLIFFPTWFDKIGFEVINPHSRTDRAGTQPIYYEVVPSGTKGKLQVLYAPMPGEIQRDNVTSVSVIDMLIDSIILLLETYGFSAKRTVGWGSANIDGNDSKVFFVENSIFHKLIGDLQTIGDYQAPTDEFKKLMKEDGNPLNILLDENGELRSKSQFKKIGGEKPCTKNEFDDFVKWYEKHGDTYKATLTPQEQEEDTSSHETINLPLFDFRQALNNHIQNGKEVAND